MAAVHGVLGGAPDLKTIKEVNAVKTDVEGNVKGDVKGLSKELVPGTRKSHRGHRMCAVHILECINRIERVYKIDPKLTNDILYDAVIRNVQTLAESTRYIKKDIRYEHVDIPWKIIKRLRNELVHGYLTVDMDEAVRTFIVHDLPNIKKILESRYPNWKAEYKKRVIPPAPVKAKRLKNGAIDALDKKE